MTRRSARLLALCLLFVGCGAPDGPGAGGTPALPASLPGPLPAPPPIVLISIDTLRSDRLPVYGYAAGETPAIDALARDSLVFERAFCHTPLTLPSHVSILTGRLPDAHGVRDNQGYRFDPAGSSFLPRELKALGYATGAAVSAWVLRGDSGLAADFDLYDDAIPLREGTALGGVARSGAETLASVEPWLRGTAGGPFFLFFHLFEPHLPHDPPDPERWDDPYDGEVAAADRVVGELLELLEELGVYDRAAIVLLSDHGEGLGDHGELEHGILLYREVLQVPLLLKLPGSARAGRVATPAQLVDVVPTLLELAGAPVPDGLPGASLLALPEEPRRIYAETFYPRLHYGWSDLASIVDGDFHFIDGPDPELYHLGDDPAETRNLLREERRRAAELRRHLEGFDRTLAPPAATDSETRERLAALGYLGGAAETAGPLPDPKAQLPTLADLRRAAELVGRGDLAAAVPLYRRVLDANPRLVDGWLALGDVLRRLGRLGEAADATARAFAASGGDGELARMAAGAYARLGLHHLQQRAWAAARDASRRAVELEPGRADAWNHLGVALFSLGERTAALDAWERALELDPQNLDTLYNLGTRAADLGRPELARRALRSFIERAPAERYRDDLRRARLMLRRLES